MAAPDDIAGRAHVQAAGITPEGLRREKAWSAAVRRDPSVRPVLKARELAELAATMRGRAEYDESQADDYSLSDGYESTVEEFRVRARAARRRAAELDAICDRAIGKVYRAILSDGEA